MTEAVSDSGKGSFPLPGFITDPKKGLKLGVCVVCLGLLYFSTFRSMVQDWILMPEYSHAFFVPFMSLYAAWKRRDWLEQLPLSPANWGIAALLFGLCLFLLGNAAAENFTVRVSFLFVLSGLILFVLGRRHLRALLFPIAFLIITIPLPSILLEEITFPMQLFASSVAELSLEALGVPVLREGNVIHLAGTTLEVAEACSGIRSLLSLLALGTAVAYFTKKVFWQRALLILSCFPIAIFMNALRVSATGVLANYYGISVAEGFFHGFSGIPLFVGGFLLVLAVGFLISKLTATSDK